MNKDNQKTSFTPDAKTFWDNIPPGIQKRLLDNIWCSHCGEMTTITDYTGRIEQGDLILDGFCIHCDNPVSRFIEGD
jgi:hypothetical protein